MIDINKGLENSNGSMKIYLQVVRFFCLESDAALLRMHMILESGKDLDALKILIHGLKGTAANIGALAFSEESKQMEQGLTVQPYVFDELKLSEYIVTYLSVLTEAKEFLADNGIVFGEDTWCHGTREFTQAQWSRRMKAVGLQLAEYEPEAALKLLQPVKEWKLLPDVIPKMNDLEHALEMLEYEKAEEILLDIMNSNAE